MRRVLKNINLFFIYVFVFVLFFSFSSGYGKNLVKQESMDQKSGSSKVVKKVSAIYLKVGSKNYKLNLENNSTVDELIEKMNLPLELSMSELNGNEKYSYLPFSVKVNPKKVGKINSGDVMLFGDDCFVVFYKSFSSSYSYTRIAHIEHPEDLEKSLGKGGVKISLTLSPDH